MVKPELKIAYIAIEGSTERLVLPEAADQNFKHNSHIMEKWQAFKEEHHKKFGQPLPAQNTDDLPDLTGIPAAPPLVEQVDKACNLEAHRLASAPLASNKKIMVTICDHAGQLQVWLDGTQLGDETQCIVLPSLETYLFGFGLGSWVSGAPHTGTGLQAIIKNDIDYIMVAFEDGTKKCQRACQLIHELEKAGKDGRFTYHEITPLENADTGRRVSGRYAMKAIKEVFFVPKAIDLVQRKSDNKPLSIHELGTLYSGRFNELPSHHASVVWDSAVLPGIDACISAFVALC